jgi:hypothetical protein
VAVIIPANLSMSRLGNMAVRRQGNRQYVAWVLGLVGLLLAHVPAVAGPGAFAPEDALQFLTAVLLPTHPIVKVLGVERDDATAEWRAECLINGEPGVVIRNDRAKCTRFYLRTLPVRSSPHSSAAPAIAIKSV